MCINIERKESCVLIRSEFLRAQFKIDLMETAWREAEFIWLGARKGKTSGLRSLESIQRSKEAYWLQPPPPLRRPNNSWAHSDEEKAEVLAEYL